MKSALELMQDHAQALTEQRDALAAELKECIGNCADPKDKRRIRELEAHIAYCEKWHTQTAGPDDSASETGTEHGK